MLWATEVLTDEARPCTHEMHGKVDNRYGACPECGGSTFNPAEVRVVKNFGILWEAGKGPLLSIGGEVFGEADDAGLKRLRDVLNAMYPLAR